MFYYHLFRVLSSIVMVYSLLIFMRILLSWVRSSIDGKPWHYLCLITGPYLALFRGVKFLRRGTFDFTPFLAISVLHILQRIFSSLQMSFGRGDNVSLKNILFIIISSLWTTFSFLLLFFAILAAVRLFTIYFNVNPASQLLSILDRILQPINQLTLKIIPKKSSYNLILIVTIALMTTLVLLGNFSLSFLGRFLGVMV